MSKSGPPTVNLMVATFNSEGLELDWSQMNSKDQESLNDVRSKDAFIGTLVLLNCRTGCHIGRYLDMNIYHRVGYSFFKNTQVLLLKLSPLRWHGVVLP